MASLLEREANHLIAVTTPYGNYGLREAPELNKTQRWSGAMPLPAIGDRVVVCFNGFGKGTVRGYLLEDGWVGVYVEPDEPPTWWDKQNMAEHKRLRQCCMAFGAELAPCTDQYFPEGEYDLIPQHLKVDAVLYVLRGKFPSSGFLRAALENKLVDAFSAADSTNAAAMHQWARWLFCCCPAAARGSAENIRAWVEHRGLLGFSATQEGGAND
jgi:hypothetical protein